MSAVSCCRPVREDVYPVFASHRMAVSTVQTERSQSVNAVFVTEQDKENFTKFATCLDLVHGHRSNSDIEPAVER